MQHGCLLQLLVSLLYLRPSHACNSYSGYSTLQSYRQKYFHVKECGQRPLYQDHPRHRRVANGKVAELGQWPWHVHIQYKKTPPCSGVLIDSDWVLTAAHCFYNKHSRKMYEAGNLTVTAATLLDGLDGDPEPENRRKVRKIYIHPRYVAEKKIENYDFMMLKLDEPFRIGPTIQTACVQIAAEVIQPGAECYVAGWGKFYRSPLNSMVSETLQYSAVPLLPKSECERYAANVSRQQLAMVTEQKLCAGVWTMDWYGPCKGDSGGPLVCFEDKSKSWYVVGVVSHGPKCGEIGFYTNITAMLDFMQTVLNGTAPRQSPSHLGTEPQVTHSFQGYRTDFECLDGSGTVAVERRCDGVSDCDDDTDETECDCTEHQSRCPNGICQMKSDWCNLVIDCDDGSDEENCEYFRCEKSEMQIGHHQVCDRIQHCEDWSDELACECDNATQFRCPMGSCIPLTWTCDGQEDCPDSSADEINCACPDDYIPCNNTKCVHEKAVCNGRDECGDNTDEENCETPCAPNEFYCSTDCFPVNVIDQLQCEEEELLSICSADKLNMTELWKCLK